MTLRAERDGCDCPPFIVRCAHFEKIALFLTDHLHPTVTEPLVRALPRFLGGRDGLRIEGTVSYFYEGPDHDAALAAFHEAEAALLRGAE